MTKKWTNNILTKTFDLKAENIPSSDSRALIISAAKPVAAFFETLGFKGTNRSDVVAQRYVGSSDRVNLMAAVETTDAPQGHFNAINISFNFQASNVIVDKHPLIIRVSLYPSKGCKYELFNTASQNKELLAVSGAPNKVVDEFLRRTEGDMRERLMGSANLRYTRQELQRFQPIATQPVFE